MPPASSLNPKVAAIHDLSGFGRASLTLAIPILASLGVQACPLPTAVLSSQTNGFERFRIRDLTEALPDFLAHWKELKLGFDAVYSGFLASPAQMNIVEECIECCLKEGGLAVVDPVLGDNGVLEATMSMEMVGRMRELVRHAHCITPNITEAALLLAEPYPEKPMEASELREWLLRLSERGPDKVIITSAPLRGYEDFCVNAAYDAGARSFWKVAHERVPVFYPGTGDSFTSVLTGCLLRGESLPLAMNRAAAFVAEGIELSFALGIPGREGILIERVLPKLHEPFTQVNYVDL